MNTLYQFPVSHFCEKARWALDYKKEPYTVKNLLPGPHFKQVKRLAPDSSVPLLRIKNQYIQGSDKIIDYLDHNIEQNQLTPDTINQEKEAREWEQFAEHNLAVPIRCYMYHELLQHKDLLIPVLTHKGPWYGKVLYHLIFPKIHDRIRSGMKINEKTAQLAKRTINDAISTLTQHLETRDYLVGNHFSRADVSVCSFLAPLLWTKNSYFVWHDSITPSLAAFRNELVSSPIHAWSENIYKNHR